MEVLEKVWTYEDLVKEFPKETRVELINNEIYMPPAPSFEHQIASKKTFKILDAFVELKQLGQVLYAPFDVLLDKYTVVQPDILFVSKENLQNISSRGLQGVPDLVVEIISPSTFHRDSVEKYQLYERYGVKEYWLVEPANQVIEVFRLENNKYVLHSFVNAEAGEEIESYLLQDFKLKRKDIFGK